ncbi:MAG: phasin family protein, partial [Mesorhizobium sp.]
MTQTYEDFSKYGKEFADNGLKSFASLSKGAQAIATEAGEYTKKS